jgi:hypothetical protein
MLRTVVFFSAGGFFTACYSNAVRRYPVFRKPLLHVACTLVGFTIGTIFHKYEEGSEERFQKLIEKHPDAPVAQLK